MTTGDGPIPPLTVDPELLERYGNQLLTAAANLPDAPPPFTVTGMDPMSQAIADKLPLVEGALQDLLPQARDQATHTASAIVAAAGKYQSADQQNAADIEKHQFDSAGGGSGSGVGGDAMGQMSQLMSMPMQMAGQAVQMPMQAMDALASLPQSVMQGVQQVSQMAGGLGGADGALAKGHEDGAPTDDDQRDDDKSREGAAAGATNGERAPEPLEHAVPRDSSPRHAAPDPVIDL